MAIYGHVWLYMAIYGHVWPYLAIYVWLYIGIYGHIWPYMLIYGHIWPRMWPHMAIYMRICIHIGPYTLPYMVMYGHLWSCIWPYMVMYDHIWTYIYMATYARCMEKSGVPEHILEAAASQLNVALLGNWLGKSEREDTFGEKCLRCGFDRSQACRFCAHRIAPIHQFIILSGLRKCLA